MTIRFAAARSGDSSVIVRTLTLASRRAAANDNEGRAAVPGGGFPRDPILRAALKHFARHGLGAAEQAHRNAERAFFAGKREEYRHWLAICRALDRRMADAVAAHRGMA
jgi:hypothetical protein